jgi:hypothetical protein
MSVMAARAAQISECSSTLAQCSTGQLNAAQVGESSMQHKSAKVAQVSEAAQISESNTGQREQHKLV